MQQKIHSAQTLGAELRNWRRRRELTQARTAARVGLEQKAISALETHTGHASIDRLLRVLSALDLELVLCDKQVAVPLAQRDG